jgi:hypothetical protein
MSRTLQTDHAYCLKALFTPQGGKILTGGGGIDREGNYVQATIVEIASNTECVKEELFAPVLYVMQFQTLEEAIELNNSVPQGLSSSIFTTNPETIFKWTGYGRRLFPVFRKKEGIKIAFCLAGDWLSFVAECHQGWAAAFSLQTRGPSSRGPGKLVSEFLLLVSFWG